MASAAEIARDLEDRYRRRYETLKDVYEQRLGSLAQSVAGLSLRLSSDSLLSELHSDPTSAAFAVAHADELVVQEVHNEREQFIVKLAAAIAEDEDQIRYHRDALASRDEEVAQLQADLHRARQDAAAAGARAEQHTLLEQQLGEYAAALHGVQQDLQHERDSRAQREAKLERVAHEAEERLRLLASQQAAGASAAQQADRERTELRHELRDALGECERATSLAGRLEAQLATQAAHGKEDDEALRARTAEIEALRHRLEERDRTVEAVRADLTSMREELKATTARFEASVNEEERESTQAIASLKQRMEAWRAEANQKIRRYKASARNAQVATQEVEAKVRSLARDLEAAEARHRALTEEKLTWETKLVRQSEQARAAEQAAQDAKELVGELRAMNAEKDRQQSARERDFAQRLQEVTQAAAAEQERLARQAQSQAREEDASIYNNIVRQFEKERDHLYSRVAELEDELHALRRANPALSLSATATELGAAQMLLTQSEAELRVRDAVDAEREVLEAAHAEERERFQEELEDARQVDEAVHLRQENERMDALREELKRYAGKCHAVEDLVEQEKDRAHAAEEQTGRAQARVKLLNAHLEEAGVNIERLTQRLAQTEAVGSERSKAAVAERRERERLEDIIEDLEQARRSDEEDLAEAKAKAASLEAAREGFEKRLAEAAAESRQRGGQEKRLQGTVDSLREEQRSFAAERSKGEAQRAALEARVGSLQADLEEQRSRLAGAASARTAQEEAMEALRRQGDTERRRAERLAERLVALGRQARHGCAGLLAEVGRLRAQLDTLRAATAQAVDRAGQEVARDVKRLRGDLAGLVKVQARDLHARYREKRAAEVSAAEARIRKVLSEEHETAVGELRRMADGHREQAQEAHFRRDEDRGELRAELERTHREAAALAAKLARLEQKHEDLQAAKGHLARRLQEAQANRERAAGEGANLSADAGELRSLLAGLHAALISVLRLRPEEAERLCNLEALSDDESDWGNGAGRHTAHGPPSFSPSTASVPGANGSPGFFHGSLSLRSPRRRSAAQRSSMCTAVLSAATARLLKEAAQDAAGPVHAALERAEAQLRGKAQQLAAQEAARSEAGDPGDANILLEMQRIESASALAALQAQLQEKERSVNAVLEAERTALAREHEAQLAELREEAARLRSKVGKVTEQRDSEVGKAREEKREAVERLEAEIAALQRSISQLEARCADAEQEVERGRRSQRMRSAARSLSLSRHDGSGLSTLHPSRQDVSGSQSSKAGSDGRVERFLQDLNASLMSASL